MAQDATSSGLDMSREFVSHSSEDAAVLGAPLEPSTLSTTICDDEMATWIRPLLFRMYIAAHILRLGTEARYAALVFLHRYVRAINRTNQGKFQRPSHWVAAACLFLATKSEDEPRRLRDMINMAYMVLNDDNDNETSTTIHNQSPVIFHLQPTPPNLDEQYWDAKKKIIETEQIVLRWLGFDVFVPHPHRAVALLLQHLSQPEQQVIAPMASQRLNDGLFHSAALQHGVLELACAAIELAKQQSGRTNIIELPPRWWHEYKISDDQVQLVMTHLQEATDILENLSMQFSNK
jgi:hypothetical protein